MNIDQQAEAARQQWANERAQVEQVFGLTGGELKDDLWVPMQDVRKVTNTLTACEPITFTYWYEGTPDYEEESGFNVTFSGDPNYFIGNPHATYRTVVSDETFGQVPETVTDDEGTWKVVARYRNSGETECPYANADDPEEMELCSLCEAAPGEEHGYIYIGDGWSEIVYRLEVPYERNTMHPGESAAEFTKRYLGESRDD